MTTIRDKLAEGRKRLSDQSAAKPAVRLETEILLARALDVSRAHLFAHPDAEIGEEPAGEFARLIERRAAGEPLAYIIGEREFWSLPLKVTPAVLIPRPETELLVEAALARIPCDAPFRVADLGTGSGAIALALASERPRCEIHATETSQEALAVARENAARLRLNNVRFDSGSWFEPLSGKFDVIACNPPYVASGDPHLEEGDLRFEPKTALVAGPGGLEAVRAIVEAAPGRLNPGGWLLLEHGRGQAAECRALLQSHGFGAIETIRDLEGSERVALGAVQKSPAL